MTDEPDEKTLEAHRRARAGAWLRDRRERLGLTQREMAARVGYRYHAYLSQLESGKVRLATHEIDAWSRALALDPRTMAQVYLALYEPDLFDRLDLGTSAQTVLDNAMRR